MGRYFGLLAGMLALGLALDAGAEPRGVHLSWTKPDTAHTMTVTWMTDSVADPSVVTYGINSDTENVVTGTVIQGNDGLGAIHTAELVDLKADTLYHYRVGGSNDWSVPFTFKTMPENPCTPYRFAALGDNRPDTDYIPQLHWHPILAEAREAGPSFIIHSGDLVKSGEDTKQWSTFFDTSDLELGFVPFLATNGNHDDGPGEGEGANYNQVFAFPRNSINNMEDFYYFTTANAIFVSISTQNYSDGNPPFSMQAQWLDEVLTQNPRAWKFVYLHHPPYSSHKSYDLIFTEFEFNHPPNEKDQNAALVPIFDKHHVDMVFAGHNHYYERFEPLKGGGGNDQGKLAAGFHDGTVYVITGGAGALTYDEFDVLGIEIDLISWVCKQATGSTLCSGKHHYVVVDIDGENLKYEVWATAEQRFGNSPNNVELIDSFTITKDIPDLCPVEPPVEPNPEPNPEPQPDVVTAEPEHEVVVQPDVAQHDLATEPDKHTEEDKSAGSDVAGVDTVQSKDTGVGDQDTTGSKPESKKSGGCAANPTSTTAGWMVLGLMALLAFFRMFVLRIRK